MQSLSLELLLILNSLGLIAMIILIPVDKTLAIIQDLEQKNIDNAM